MRKPWPSGIVSQVKKDKIENEIGVKEEKRQATHETQKWMKENVNGRKHD